MAVNFPSIDLAKLHPVAGVTLGYAEANIRKPNHKDVLVIRVDERATVAGVFTQNRFCAAPVTVCREHLAAAGKGGKGIRALVVNTGNANASTGEPGMVVARETCAELACLAGLDAQQVLPFSTGVILEPLPLDRLKAGLPAALANQQAAHWFDAAQAIMTTDTLPKASSRQVTIDGHTVTLSGISKGAGMIKPNMATMLGFLVFDVNVAQPVLDELVKHVADRLFNCITIDGDTSTNDSFILIASGKSSLPAITSTDSPAYAALRDAVTDTAQELAQLILAAIGYAGVTDLDVGKIDLYLDDVLVAKAGGRNPDYREEDGQRVMKKSEILIRVVLGRGDATATVWTCDLSHDYVSINADYRS